MLKSITNNTTRTEWLLLILLAVFFVLIITIPNILLWQQTPDGYKYNYTTYMNPADNFVYYSYLEQTKEQWIIYDLYTTEKNIGQVRPFWLTLGKVGNLFNLSNFAIFHIFRIVIAFFAVFFIYFLLKKLSLSKRNRWLSLFGILFATGQGWLYVLGHPDLFAFNNWRDIPFDFMIPESFLFMSSLVSPHFILSWILLLVSLYLSMSALNNINTKNAIWAGLSCLVLFWLHPFYVPTLVVVLVIFYLYLFLFDKQIWYKILKILFIIFTISSPAIIYYASLFVFDNTIVIKTMQNILPSPSLSINLFSFGLSTVLAIFGSFIWLKKRPELQNQIFFLLSWVIVGWLLIYFPVPWQRRLVEGWFFPAVVLSSFTIIWIYDRFIKQKMVLFRIGFIVLLLFLFGMGSINILVMSMQLRKSNDSYFYRPQEIDNVVAWFNENTERDIKIIKNGPVFYWLPGLINRQNYFGHLVETINSHSKFLEIKWLFNNDLNSERKYDFFVSKDISYLVYDISSPSLNSFHPENKQYLTLVFESGDYYIYQIIK